MLTVEETSTFNDRFGGMTPFKVQVNFIFLYSKVRYMQMVWWETYYEKCSTEEFEMFGTEPTWASF